MTIRKGRIWGEAGGLDAHGVVVGTDRDAARALAGARRTGTGYPMLGLAGGDLCTTLGGTGSVEHLTGPDAHRFSMDLGVATLDGVEHVFVAHLIVRRRFWRGRIVAVMNAQWLGDWDLGPKSHPNDGLLDVSDAHLSMTDKLAARKRVRTGTHVPHPKIAVKRTRAATFAFDPPAWCHLDGERVGKVEHLEVAVEPDAYTAVV